MSSSSKIKTSLPARGFFNIGMSFKSMVDHNNSLIYQPTPLPFLNAFKSLSETTTDVTGYSVSGKTWFPISVLIYENIIKTRIYLGGSLQGYEELRIKRNVEYLEQFLSQDTFVHLNALVKDFLMANARYFIDDENIIGRAIELTGLVDISTPGPARTKGLFRAAVDEFGIRTQCYNLSPVTRYIKFTHMVVHELGARAFVKEFDTFGSMRLQIESTSSAKINIPLIGADHVVKVCGGPKRPTNELLLGSFRARTLGYANSQFCQFDTKRLWYDVEALKHITTLNNIVILQNRAIYVDLNTHLNGINHDVPMYDVYDFGNELVDDTDETPAFGLIYADSSACCEAFSFDVFDFEIDVAPLIKACLDCIAPDKKDTLLKRDLFSNGQASDVNDAAYDGYDSYHAVDTRFDDDRWTPSAYKSAKIERKVIKAEVARTLKISQCVLPLRITNIPQEVAEFIQELQKKGYSIVDTRKQINSWKLTKRDTRRCQKLVTAMYRTV